MAKSKIIAGLSLLATLLALVVIGLGAFTRQIDAGLGCPDWPGCYGQIVVPTGAEELNNMQAAFPSTPLVVYKAKAEMIHRYFVGVLSLLIFALAYLIVDDVITNNLTRAMKKERNTRWINIGLTVVLLVLLVYQIILGMRTVTWKLMPIIVTQHLLGGMLILSTLWLMFLNNRNTKPLPRGNEFNLLPWAVIALLLVFGQIFLGAWASTNYASLSCPNFPMCMSNQDVDVNIKQAFNFYSPMGVNYQGGTLSLQARQTIQIVHRFGAVLLTLYMLLFSGVALSRLRFVPEMAGTLYLIWGLLILQLSLGISNVVYKLPLVTALGHTIVAALLLLALLTFIFRLATSQKVVRL